MCDHVYTEREYVTPLFENPLTVLSICAETFYHEAIKRFPTGNYGEWLADWFEGTASVCYFTAQDLMHIICIAVVLSIVRYILNITVFKKIPLWLKMGPDSASKFPESCSSTIIYSVSWFWALFIVLTNPKNIFLDLSTHWRTWIPGATIELSIYWLYMYQMGTYIHFVLTLLVFNVKRKDFTVLFIHHIVTLCLLVWSFAVRFYYVGFILVFLLDIGDVLLELSKTLVYLSDLNGKKVQLPQQMANVMFLIFTVQWILCRLYWFPMKVLQSSGHVSMVMCPTGWFYIPFNILLFVIYLMQIYWFYFIVKLLVKVLIIGEDVEDNREYKNEESKRKKDR